jgi:acyl carrier protein
MSTEETTNPAPDDLQARVNRHIVEVLSVKPEQVVPEARYGEDLDADSLDLVELIMALEEEFDVKIPEPELADIQTVQQTYDVVRKYMLVGQEAAPKQTPRD